MVENLYCHSLKTLFSLFLSDFVLYQLPSSRLSHSWKLSSPLLFMLLLGWTFLLPTVLAWGLEPASSSTPPVGKTDRGFVATNQSLGSSVEEFILFSGYENLVKVSASGIPAPADYQQKLFVGEGTTHQKLDVDCHRKYIFWIYNGATILRVNYDGTDARIIVKDDTVFLSISVDWITGNVYVINSPTPQDRY